MSTLAEIEAAADNLSPEQKQELILFLAVRLRTADVKPPSPRQFTPEEVSSWIADDEADMRRFQEGM